MFDERGLEPAVCQDATTGEVLMPAYMNCESLARAQASGEAWFWSRSRQDLWHTGATSGNVPTVESIHIDCDAHALVVKVRPAGPACHTGERTCFYRRLD